ncbi:hypothetical protein [Candidatus Phytoplasma australiense]|uniref:Uncharacterized protein n=1 Tax=Strawberry lethal yellows phytoplasma (CPA) str. NZSb11 TaxID=980422 RepID=R4S254_PHYAS|nr:hypothetical protein [Candidatus Phytoplasma australiense]AGL90534.1 hypothetical protein SLY_0618 [Strawberry lethal yellows phytoplasma (CPA) str. NZSb11]AGL90618.1 hypothetical protein SLY_0703 [Strawberry lethal yellows phytoplasma (CPA) str. NZSb11]AGL90883.1 hypothetical protein SLY_0969 [Strawberry lethal yellows phytoplasma (CPA) str. NZSb11]
MFIFSIFATISNFILKYSKGFTTTEILERRMDGIQTTLFTILVVSGFKPIFKLIANTLNFFKDLILGIFFPNKKLQKLEIQNAKQEYLEKQLLKKLDKINENQEKLQSQIMVQRVKVSHWQEKKARKKQLKSQNINPIIKKEDENE